MPSHTTTTPPHLGSQTHTLVPEKEIRKVVNFFGLEMVNGRIDVPVFDQAINALIAVTKGELQAELVQLKLVAKRLLADQTKQAENRFTRAEKF